MATSSGEFRRKLDGSAAWVTHAAIWLGVLLVLPRGLWYVFDWKDPLPLTWWSIGSVVALLITMFLMSYHENGAMCERCFAEVPADAAIRATHKGGFDHRMLWYFHKNWVVVLLLAIGVPAIGILLDTYATSVLWCIADVMLLISWRSHRLLRPWCPWCNRWDHGGDHECVPNPDPSMEKTV